MTDSDYIKIKENSSIIYKEHNKLFSPYFKDNIVFNSEGFNHLIYKNKSERPKKEQAMRFKLLPRAFKLMELTTVKQDFYESNMSIKKKFNGKNKYIEERVLYYGFIGIIDDFRIKVVIRKIGNGNIHFWSVIPAWNTKYFQNIKIIENFENNLDVDL